MVLYQNKIHSVSPLAFAVLLLAVIKQRCIAAGTPFWIGGELPVFVVRHHAPNQDACTVTVRDEYMYRATPKIYTGAGHIIRISSKSGFISLIPFKKWNLYNVYIHSTQTDIFQVFISFNFDDYNWQLMKTQNSVSHKIRILLKTNTKKGFLEILANWKVWTWKVWACTALNT